MSELREWKQKAATGTLNSRQERRMQFLQNQQNRQRMANQAEQVMQRGFEQSRTGAPQQPAAPAQQENWVQGVPSPDLAQNYNPAPQENSLTPFQGAVSQLQKGEYKLNNPQSWPIHASNRQQQQGIGSVIGMPMPNGQNIDPGFNRPWTQAPVPQNWSPTPNIQMPQNGGLGSYRPGSDPRLDKVFEYMKRNRQQGA